MLPLSLVLLHIKQNTLDFFSYAFSIQLPLRLYDWLLTFSSLLHVCASASDGNFLPVRRNEPGLVCGKDHIVALSPSLTFLVCSSHCDSWWIETGAVACVCRWKLCRFSLVYCLRWSSVIDPSYPLSCWYIQDASQRTRSHHPLNSRCCNVRRWIVQASRAYMTPSIVIMRQAYKRHLQLKEVERMLWVGRYGALH